MGWFWGSAASPREMLELRSRVRALEDMVAQMAQHLGVEFVPPDHLAPVREAMARGRKIEAIKLYREATGCGLAEAKHAVERGV